MKFQERFRDVDRVKIVRAAKKSLRSEEGKKALIYLKEERGFTDEIIDKFELGYCPEHINHQLRGRIIIPIYDVYENLLAISSKHLNKNHPSRFWHESFDKSFNLFALNFAKNNIIKHRKVILVEGEFDVIFLHSRGFTMTVGLCGSAFTIFQACLLARYCSEVFIMFDGDKAGRCSIKRVTKLCKKYHLDKFDINYFPVYLPKDMDPDEYLRDKGSSQFKKMMKQSREDMELEIG